jgi:hypothetical protein
LILQLAEAVSKKQPALLNVSFIFVLDMSATCPRTGQMAEILVDMPICPDMLQSSNIRQINLKPVLQKWRAHLAPTGQTASWKKSEHEKKINQSESTTATKPATPRLLK